MQSIYETLELNLSEPFVSHKGITDTLIQHTLIKICWNGLVGYGVAIPAKEYGVTNARLQINLKKLQMSLFNASPFQLRKVLLEAEKILAGQMAALSAIDMAMYDILAKAANLPLHHLLGLADLPLPPTAVSIGLGAKEETLKRIKTYIKWPILKLKMSKPNIILIKAIRTIYSGRLWIDGNGAWEMEQAIQFSHDLAKYDVELIEQPIPAGTINELGIVHKNSPIPIIADEDCCFTDDLFKLKDSVSGVNIKLMKCGGIHKSLELIQLARQLNLKVMLGCKTESLLGVTATAHLAALADFVDLDGHLDIVNDPFSGMRIDDGKIYLPENSGLGVIKK